MSREIKFRAWNGNEIFNVDVMAISPCTWDCPDYGKRGVSLAYQPNIQVMQYTGLKDKNGVEIYEADILEFEDEDFKWIVKYNFGSCIAVGGEHNQSEELIEFYDWSKGRLDVVVVGNIYEHPHLLEVTR